MTIKLFIFLVIGTIAMGVPILGVCGKYQIARWKGLIATLILTIVGTLGTFLMYWIENGRWGDLSFYGAVFLVPVAFLAISPLLRISYGAVTDLCAIGECIMLALMKVHCMLGGCCLGRELFVLHDGSVIRFPSRTFELLVALVLFCVFLLWVVKSQNCKEFYAWFFVLYGSTRFVLNIFREAWVTKEMLLPIGNIWSIVSVIIGGIWLTVLYKKKNKPENAI